MTSSVGIDAAIEKVWAAFSDYTTWGKWNSFMPMVNGDVGVGNVVEMPAVTPGLKAMVFKPRIFEVSEMEKVSWGGGFLFLYNGIHDFLFKRMSGHKTRFIQIEKFEGPMVLYMDNMIRKTALGYTRMNEGFKDHVEAKA